MTEIIIRDVPIQFPFKPYKVQEDYMNKVLECLQQGVNGVLESPTGTGKTLSLLCSSLAWLQAKKAQLQVNAQGLLLNNNEQELFKKSLQSDLQKSAGSVPAPDVSWSERLTTPHIIYASRTHSQLTQVMKELKRTSYSHVKAAVLGSREQLCIHPDLAEERGYMKISMCRTKVDGRSCHYYNIFDARRHDSSFIPEEVMDIEDLVKRGHKYQCCPYYLTRDMMTTADIIFMPYNYLLDPQTRRVQGISLINAVVILDEAHNVERMCEESASASISSTDIALCIAEVTQVMKKFNEDMTHEGGEETLKDFTEHDLCDLKDTFLRLEKAIDEIKLDPEMPNDKWSKKNKKFPGSYIFQLLSIAKIKVEQMAKFDNLIAKLIQYLSTMSHSALATKGNMLSRFSQFLQVVFGSLDGNQTDLFYKVYIEQEVPKKHKADSWASKSSTKTVLSPTAKVVNFWCFSPAFTMRSLMRQGVHSIIMTSGTLSPLHATVSELGIPMPVQLENPHIIEPSQINVTIVSKGPKSEVLQSSYNNRENTKYLEDLGMLMTNFCRVIPDGVLIFFPSYPMMEKIVNYWQQTGVWSQINDLKTLFVEPQQRGNLPEVMREYNRALEVEGSRGAAFIAVLRGKVSEGMDFADTRCRAVIITGLPFAPFMDPRVQLKKEYVDNLHKTDRKALTGNEWYELDAIRAVNQAVGRVIRHASDFGAILLCDNRFSRPTITHTLSAWLRPHIVSCSAFGPAYGRVTKFFKALGLNPPAQHVVSGASFDYTEIKLRTKAVAEKKQTEREKKGPSMKEFLAKVCMTQPPKPLPQPSPSGLLDALNIPSSQNKTVDILKSVYKQSEEEDISVSYVQPAPKKRKFRIAPLKFDTNPESSSETPISTSERNKLNAEYLRQVKRKLSAENYLLFMDCVKTYATSDSISYDSIVMTIRKLFPGFTTKDLFIGFKRYIKADHAKQFEELCLRMYGTTTV